MCGDAHNAGETNRKLIREGETRMGQLSPTPHGEQSPYEGSVATQSVFTWLLGMPVSIAMQEAVRLGIPDLLDAGPKHVAVLASTVNVDTRTLLLLLRALASVDVFQEIAEEVFAQTVFSAILRADLPGSLFALARVLGTSWCRASLANLASTLETGHPSFETFFQKDLHAYLSEHPEEQHLFRQTLALFSEPLIADVVRTYDFSTVGTLVDIGSGDGSFLITVLKQYPSLQGLLLSLPPQIEDARLAIEQAGLAQRCTCLEGNFFEGVPVGAEVYFLQQILRGWNDEQCVQLLSNCGKAMATGGRVLVAEYVIPRPPHKPSPVLFIGLWMSLLRPGGYERTETQLRTLCERAGLSVVRMWATSSAYSLLEAKKAGT